MYNKQKCHTGLAIHRLGPCRMTMKSGLILYWESQFCLNKIAGWSQRKLVYHTMQWK